MNSNHLLNKKNLAALRSFVLNVARFFISKQQAYALFCDSFSRSSLIFILWRVFTRSKPRP